ncbi:MFS family permease [Allocatelliglobosispora scoriae]|uniref:MFS family permease n=1 Tax=Allocatelliglobosispora scoriae TaxID=643052 RepID=A0A841BR30_9ACTN|nr:MFS transporter [Allocatelliglobosispora scoriae]MBB5869816.1 MFS family permease [Allocatelliglobosispora scoriae]
MNPNRARWAVLIIFAVHGSVTGSFASRLPWIADHVGVTSGQLGFALVMPAIGALCAMQFSAKLVQLMGGRLATQVLISAWCATLALPAFAPNLVVLSVMMLFAGACAGTADMAMNAEGVAVEGLLGRPIMSSLHGGWSVGGFLAGGLGALLAHRAIDARLHFTAVAVFLIIVGVTAGSFLPAGRKVPVGEKSGPAFSLPRGPVLIIGLVGFAAVFAEASSADWSALYLVQVLDAGEGAGALAYAFFAGAMTIARFVGDAVVRRFGAVRTTQVAGAVGTVGGVLVVVSWTPVVAMAGFVLIGVGIATVVPLAFSAAGHSTTDSVSSTNAIAGVATVAYGAGLAAPGIVGGIANVSSLTVSFGVVTVLVLIVALSAKALKPADKVSRSKPEPVLEPAIPSL